MKTYKNSSATDLIHGLMLIWKQKLDACLDEDEIKDFMDEEYIKDLLFDLSSLCDEYAVDFNQLLKEHQKFHEGGV
tara:strand:+ start:758 stop:985 length:228 start_codon:yes stop_codon:yes gene_type:complete